MRSYLDLKTFETVLRFIYRKFIFMRHPREYIYFNMFEEHLEW